MPFITKLSRYDVVGARDLINPQNSPEAEKLRQFTAKLFFLDIQDGTQDQIVPVLLERHSPPRTHVISYDADGHFCIVVFEWQGREGANVTHIPILLSHAKEYCKDRPRDRKIFDAETFFARSPGQFKRIMKDTLDVDVVLG